MAQYIVGGVFLAILIIGTVIGFRKSFKNYQDEDDVDNEGAPTVYHSPVYDDEDEGIPPNRDEW